MTHPITRLRPSPRNLPASKMPQYKYSIGQTVALRWPATSVRPKDPKRSQADSTFEITRLLPEQGDLVHYRVKNATTGQERVVAEIDLHSKLES